MDNYPLLMQAMKEDDDTLSCVLIANQMNPAPMVQKDAASMARADTLPAEQTDALPARAAADAVFPLSVARMTTLSNGRRYVSVGFAYSGDDLPFFADIQHYLLLDTDEGTLLAARWVAQFDSTHSTDAIGDAGAEEVARVESNEQGEGENCSKCTDRKCVASCESNESNESNEPEVMIFAPTAVEDYRMAHAGGRPAADWIAEMAALPPHKSYHYWFAKDGDHVCMVKDRGVFFGFSAYEGHLLEFDCYVPLAVMGLSPLLQPCSLESYRPMVDALCGRTRPENVLCDEVVSVRTGLTNAKRMQIMHFLQPASGLMCEGLPFLWEELWEHILGSQVICSELTNTVRVKFKAFKQPLLANIICWLRNNGVVENYADAELNKRMGFDYPDSFRQALGTQPQQPEIRQALTNILSHLNTLHN